MSVTAEATRKRPALKGRKPAPGAPSAAVPGELVAPPPRLRRRPVLVAVSAAAVCLGALLGVWAYTSTSTAHEVLGVRTAVQRGQLIGRQDLVVVRVGVDPALRPVPASRLDTVVGLRAASDVPAGGLLTEDAVTNMVVPGRGLSVVGVALPAALMPGEPLRVGDAVRVVATPGAQGELTGTSPRFIPASVVGLYPDVDNAVTVVSLQVPYGAAAELAARSATGRVALVLDSRER